MTFINTFVKVYCLSVLCSFVGTSPFGSYSSIINGENVINEAFPFVVTVNSEEDGFMGSGAIIAPNWVITVGHLFADLDQEDMQKITIGYGSIDRSKQLQIKPKRVVSSQFNITTRLGDIALIQIPNIGQNAHVSSGSVSISELNETAHQHKLTLVGWGDTTHPNGQSPTSLKMTRLWPYDLDDCRHKLILKHRNWMISDESNLCLYSPTSSSCYGDSGSPVFEITNDPIKVRLLGLVSWGNQSCSLGYPTVFTKIYYYKNIINQVTGLNIVN